MKLARRNVVLAIGGCMLLLVTTPAHAVEFQPIKFDNIKLKLEKDEKYDAKKHLTEAVEKLQGKKIRISGWIHPDSVYSSKNNKRFILVRDNKECCFGPGASLHDCIVVQMEGDASVDFTTQAITVEGVFQVQEVPGGRDGRQLAIYQMKATKAK